MRTLTTEMADNVGEWRKRAERLRALAKVTHRRQAHADLIDLARQWEGMAARAEAGLRRKLAAAD